MNRLFISPNAPDFWQCNEFYGAQLDIDDCYAAVSFMPSQITYNVSETGAYTVPWTHQVGMCYLSRGWSNYTDNFQETAKSQVKLPVLILASQW